MYTYMYVYIHITLLLLLCLLLFLLIIIIIIIIIIFIIIIIITTITITIIIIIIIIRLMIIIIIIIRTYIYIYRHVGSRLSIYTSRLEVASEPINHIPAVLIDLLEGVVQQRRHVLWLTSQLSSLTSALHPGSTLSWQTHTKTHTHTRAASQLLYSEAI